MTRYARVTFVLCVSILSVLASAGSAGPKISETEFAALMKMVADGWNEGDARKSADCFAEDAVYLEPPNRQVYVGRNAIYQFFGGPNRPTPPMKMKWHHLAFNPSEQVGYGEYTFQGQHRYHGIVTVLIVSGKISKWREYQYQSEVSWEDFVGRSRF